MAATYLCSLVLLWVLLIFLLLCGVDVCMGGQIGLGSRLLASEDRAWVSDNGTFALGFTPMDTRDRFQVAIWFAQLPGDRTIVWSANRNSPVTKDAYLELSTTGNLLLVNQGTTTWISNTTRTGITSGSMEETGNFILYTNTNHIAWQSFSHPTNTLLPNQPLTFSLELTTPNTPQQGGYYSLTMLQQPSSLSLALTYNLVKSYNTCSEAYSNYSYWLGPEISNVTGEVVAVLDDAGSFGIVYGESSNGAVYIYKNDGDYNGLSSATNGSTRSAVLRRIILETNGNLRLYRWDDHVNGSRQWVPEWAAISNPCQIPGTCGNGICNLDRSNTNASCTSLPGSNSSSNNSNRNSSTNTKEGNDFQCTGNSFSIGNCESNRTTNDLIIQTEQQTNYYFSDYSVIANYSDAPTVSKCGDACLSECECLASVYGLDDEKPYCWLLRSLDFGGYENPGSTLFVKVQSNGSLGSSGGGDQKDHDGSGNVHQKEALGLPIVISMVVLVGFLCLLLFYYVKRKRSLKRAMENACLLSGIPINFSYRDLQIRTSNFSQLLGTGGFGSVYKGSLGDGTLIAVKKLDKILPHGEKEFLAEVSSIGSMHHMNLVRLCGYCSEGSHRLLVYEFMKNGSLDKWIFPLSNSAERVLDWSTRFNIAIATAQGIAYFHEQCRNRVIHCDIKPENILLDEKFCPKVSDFGLAKLMGREHSHVVTMVRGTRGYLAPEWVSNRPITVKADVYSYGMLLLEIVGGRRNLDLSFDAEDFFYPGWAFKGMKDGTPLKVADRRLKGSVNELELMRTLKVAFWCIQDEVIMRPSMGEVVKMLEGSMEINTPPMPQTVLELVEEGLDQVYKAMKREINQSSLYPITSITLTSSHATCSYSTMSPR